MTNPRPQRARLAGLARHPLPDPMEVSPPDVLGLDCFEESPGRLVVSDGTAKYIAALDGDPCTLARGATTVLRTRKGSQNRCTVDVPDDGVTRSVVLMGLDLKTRMRPTLSGPGLVRFESPIPGPVCVWLADAVPDEALEIYRVRRDSGSPIVIDDRRSSTRRVRYA